MTLHQSGSRGWRAGRRRCGCSQRANQRPGMARPVNIHSRKDQSHRIRGRRPVCMWFEVFFDCLHSFTRPTVVFPTDDI